MEHSLEGKAYNKQINLYNDQSVEKVVREYNKGYIGMGDGAGRNYIRKSFPEKVIFKLRSKDQ